MSEIKPAFLDDLLKKDLDKVASQWILDRVPHIFNTNHGNYIDWKLLLAQQLDVDCNTIVVVGTAGVGISLNPYKNYKPFQEKSDIDIAVVSEYHFGEAWRFLRQFGPRIHTLRPKERESVNEHVHRLIYWGMIATDHILPLFPFSKRWMAALSHMATVDPTVDRAIKIRVFKDFECLRSYHIHNLRNLREQELERNSKS